MCLRNDLTEGTSEAWCSQVFECCMRNPVLVFIYKLFNKLRVEEYFSLKIDRMSETLLSPYATSKDIPSASV